ncbi:MAG: ATP-binding protein [Limisphaerales bacterium]
MADLEHTVNLGRFFALEFQDLQKTAELRAYGAGDVIFSQGDLGDGFFHVEDGQVEISAKVGDDDYRVFARVGPGEIFGEMAVLDDGPRSATARASTETKAYFIGREELFRILQNNPEAMIRLLRFFSHRIRKTNEQYIGEVLQAEKLSVIGRFARNIVHDFKNPLNVIGLASEMAVADWSNEESRVSSLDRIQRQTRRMTNMLNELLEFSRGEAQGLVPNAVNYVEYVQELVADVQPDLKEKKIDVFFESTDPVIDARIDTQRVSHLFYNLINNAADEMRKGGPIRIKTKKDGDCILTEIRDSGPGIASEIATQLFEPFATHGKAHGTGLGLSICKKIVNDHGGEIWAESKEGHGAQFFFTLPQPSHS